MSQNGPYPGPPSHSWSSEGTDEPYTAPSDPWGEHPTASGPAPWGGHSTSVPPAMDSSYDADPLSAAPPSWTPPPPGRRNGPIVAIVVVLALLILAGIGTTAWLLVTRAKAPGTGTALPTTQPTSAAADVAEPQPSEDARFVKKWQCVRNEGSTEKPSITIVSCTSGTYLVLKRVDGRTTGEADAEAKCAKVPGYTKWYFYDTALDSLDFVLCLRER